MSLMFIFFIIYTSYILLLRVYIVCTPVYACLCLCVCVCARACVCVCAYLFECIVIFCTVIIDSVTSSSFLYCVIYVSIRVSARTRMCGCFSFLRP